MELVHCTHIGIEGCLRHARNVINWPDMTTHLYDYISQSVMSLCHIGHRKPKNLYSNMSS